MASKKQVAKHLTTMPSLPKPTARRQRHKKAVTATRPRTVSAAVSIPTDLYHLALNAAETTDEGNFSRYVRKLIKRDVNQAA